MKTLNECRTTKDILSDVFPKVEQHRIMMINSLLLATAQCGGCPDLLKEKVISGLTVLELVDMLAHNNVRFTYIGEIK